MASWLGVRNHFITGLVLVAPLIITIYVLQVATGIVVNFIDPFIQQSDLASYTANIELIAYLVTVLALVVFITLVGYLTQRPYGRRVFGSMGRAVALVPMVRTIYATVRQISNSFSNKETSYDSLVLIEFPRKGIYCIGLVTNESPEAVHEVAGETVHNVFLPSSPNPASGRLVLVPEDQLYDVDLSVRQGLGLLMTTGAGQRQLNTDGSGDVDLGPADVAASFDPTDEIAAELGVDARDVAADSSTAETGEESVDGEESPDRD